MGVTAADPRRVAPSQAHPTDDGEPPRRRLLGPTGRTRVKDGLAAGFALLVALNVAVYCDVVGIDAVDEVVRVGTVATLLFALAGFGLVRYLLPEPLRAHEVLWILPVGACAIALPMTVLGFAGVPYVVNLVVVIAGYAVLTATAVRRRGPPARPPSLRAIAWPTFLGVLLFALVLIPMFRSGFATVVGQGQDAHMAAGTAELYKHVPPRGIDASLPVDQEWPTWRSKQAIYYATAAVSTLSAMETYEVLSVLASLMFALSAVGMFLVAREMFGAGIGLAALAMTIASLDRMVVHTAMHPYYNQIWGYMTMPFAFVLAWVLVKHPRWRTALLLGLVLVVQSFAYPLAAPIVGTALLVFWWTERRRRRKAGEHVVALDWRGWWRSFRALPKRIKIPGVVVFLLLLGPFWGAYEKLVGANMLLINPNYSLELWGGDLSGYYPEPWFFGLPDEAWWPAGVGAIVVAAAWTMWRLPRPMAWGLLTVILAGAFVAGTMHLRDYGWYFHFKVLAFIGPLLVVLAVLAARRLRYGIGVTLLALWVSFATSQAREEISTTFDELPRTVLELRTWASELPPGASVRLDMDPGNQTWVAYMLHTHRVCSQRPLMDTAYPHVQISRQADYVLVRRGQLRPVDATGPALKRNREFTLFRMKTGLGRDECSQRMIQTVSKIQRG